MDYIDPGKFTSELSRIYYGWSYCYVVWEKRIRHPVATATRPVTL